MFSTVINMALWSKFGADSFHRLSFHIPQALWITFREKDPQNYRQELTLAVISRMLFCRLVSPFFSCISTLRMLYKTVE